MSRSGSRLRTNRAISTASLLYRSPALTPSRATSNIRLPTSIPITLRPLQLIPTSIMLIGSGPSTGLHTGAKPLLPFVLRTQESRRASRSARPQKALRGHEVPPAPSYPEGAPNVQSGVHFAPGDWVPALQSGAAHRIASGT